MSCRTVKIESDMIGRGFKDIIHGQNHADLDLFMSSFRNKAMISAMDLQLHYNDSVACMHFFGYKDDDRFIICAGSDLEDMLALCVDPAVKVQSNRDVLIHRFITALLTQQRGTGADAHIFDDLSRLNNEVINTNRELAKRNLEIFLEKEMNRVAIASIGEAVVATDVHGKITIMNATAEYLTGWSSKDTVGKDVAEVVRFVHGVEERPLHHLFHTSIEQGIISSLPKDAVLIRRDGKKLSVSDSIAPIKDTSGRTNGVVITFRDISERRRAEEALTASEERFREIFNHANDGIQIHEWAEFGLPGRFIDVNEVSCRALGYSREEMLHMQPSDISTGYHDPPIEKVLESLRNNGSAKFETEHRSKDGSIISVEINDRILELNGRKVMIGVIRDITERKRTQKALQQANAKLGILNSVTRHDMLNQITIINGFLELSRLKETDPALIEYFDKISRAAGNVKKQIAFTKDYQDMGIKAPAWVLVGSQTADAFAMLNPPGVTLEDATGGVEVLADRLAEKVPYNLIDNSMRHGGHVTHIRMSAEQVGDAKLIIYQDDGVGISAKDRKHLFEKGFGKNTGLGLFLIREILAITGINIVENGQAGQGVRFEMLVPAGAWRRSQAEKKTDAFKK